MKISVKVYSIASLVSLAFVTLTSLLNINPSDEKVNINLDAVNSIEILKAYRPPDTTQCVWKRLNKEQVKAFVDKWNSPIEKDFKKYSTSYRIAIFFKNKSIREFRANGQFINENKNWCFDFIDKTYFDKLYSEATVKSIR